MITYTARILQFEQQGEKTRWMYIEIPADLAAELNPGFKKSYRVKGKLDNFPIEIVALMPMGDGSFIMPFNAQMRKGTGKKTGAMLKVSLEVDKRSVPLNPDLLDCLSDEPEALKFFNSLSKSHQSYFSKWIDSAKTDSTKAKRIAESVKALLLKRHFGQMMQARKN